MTNGIRRKVIKQGGSRVVSLPPTLLEQVGWSKDQDVLIKVQKERRLLIEPIDKPPTRNLFDTTGGE